MTALLAVTGCEFAVDNEKRLARAAEAAAQKDYRAAAIELKNVLQSDPGHIEARLLLGKISLQVGDAETAVKELARAQELGASVDRVTVPLARALLAVGNRDEVLALAVTELTEVRDRADLNAIHGHAWLQKLDIERAEQSFQSALAANPGHVDGLVGMARIHVERGNNAAAERAVRRVIIEHPGAHAAYAVLGRLQLSDAEHVAAEESFRQAISHSQDPALRRERLSYLAGLIDVLLLQKRAGEAQDYASQMLALAPRHPFALFQAARADFEAGDLTAAIEKSQTAISNYPDYQPARLMLAAAAMSRENFALAEMHLQSLISANPDNAEARKLLAQAQMSLGSPDLAYQALEPLLQGSATDPQVLALAGSAGLRSGRIDEGLDYIERSAKAARGDAEVQIRAALSFVEAGDAARALDILRAMPASMHGEWRDNVMVMALLRGGDVAGARDFARNLVAEQPEAASSYRILGGFHLSMDELPEARAAYQSALDLDPESTAAAMSLARIDVMNDDLAAASRTFEALISRDKSNIAAYVGLAELAERDGDQKRAVTLLEKALQENPDSLQPAMLLANYYLRSGQPDKALQRAEQAQQIAPDNVRVVNMLGLAQLGSRRNSEALRTFERALKLNPRDTAAHYNVAQAQLRLGMDDSARNSLDRVLQIDPRHRAARVAITRFDSLAGNYSAALGMLVELKDDYPEDADLLVLEGDIHVMRSHYNDAIAAYDAAAEIRTDEQTILKQHQTRLVAGRKDAEKVLLNWLLENPGSSQIRVALAQSYQAAGRNEAAVAEYKRVLESSPNDVVALNNLAWLYAEMGGSDNLEIGIEIARTAHRQMPELAPVTDTYGWLLLLQGNIDEATEILREAVKQAPDNPDIRYHLAVALQRQGAETEARDLLDAILERSSGFQSRADARALRERL